MASSSKAPKKSFDDIMKTVQATGARATSNLSVCLSPDISQKLVELEYDIEVAREREQDERERRDPDRSTSNRRMADDESTVAELETQREKLIDDNLDVFYDMSLRAARRDEWADLLALHPAKDDISKDEQMGVHWKTFVPAAVRACLTDPEPTDERLAYLDEALTPGEWDRIGLAIIRLNNSVRDLPKSRRSTSTTTSSDDDSE